MKLITINTYFKEGGEKEREDIQRRYKAPKVQQNRPHLVSKKQEAHTNQYWSPGKIRDIYMCLCPW